MPSIFRFGNQLAGGDFIGKNQCLYRTCRIVLVRISSENGENRVRIAEAFLQIA